MSLFMVGGEGLIEIGTVPKYTLFLSRPLGVKLSLNFLSPVLYYMIVEI